MNHDKSTNEQVRELMERLALDDLEVSTDGCEPSIYVHCGRPLSLGEFRCIDDLANDLYWADYRAREGEQ